MKSPKTITATVAGLALVVSLAAPALAQQRSATGYLKGDSQSLGLIMNMAEQNRMNVQTLGETVNNHELRLENIEIKAISELQTMQSDSNNPHQAARRVQCPTGFTPMACFARIWVGGGEGSRLTFGQATGNGCSYPSAAHYQITAEQVSCLRIGITAAAVGGDDVATGGQ